MIAVAEVHYYACTERRLARNKVDAVPCWKAGVTEEVYHDERHHAMDSE